MRVLVIDNHYDKYAEVKRGERLAAKIRSMGFDCSHQMYEWRGEQENRIRSWDDEAKNVCREIAQSAEVFLIHGSNRWPLEFAGDLCPDKFVLFYSGGKGLLEGNERFLHHCAAHPRHCICKQSVTEDVDAVEWNLEGCLKAIKNGDPTFCEALNEFNGRLEAKLNFLYACLGGCDSIKNFIKAPESEQPFGWRWLANCEIPWKQNDNDAEQSKMKLADIFPEGNVPELSRDQLVRLREGLLEDE